MLKILMHSVVAQYEAIYETAGKDRPDNRSSLKLRGLAYRGRLVLNRLQSAINTRK